MTNDALKKLIELLEGLKDKRLARSYLWDSDLWCGCLLGSICGEEVRRSVRQQALAYQDVSRPGMPILFASPEAAKWAHGIGLTAEDVYQLQGENDVLSLISPEARYAKMLAWLKNELRFQEECVAWNEKEAKKS